MKISPTSDSKSPNVSEHSFGESLSQKIKDFVDLNFLFSKDSSVSQTEKTSSSHVVSVLAFELFLEGFVPKYKEKFIQKNKADWQLDTTGTKESAELKKALDLEMKLMLSNRRDFQFLSSLEKSGEIQDPILKRQLNVLVRMFKANQIPKDLLEKITEKEAELSQITAQFRPKINGKSFSESDIQEVLKSEMNIEKRKQAWAASKEIGIILAPKLLELVSLRNQAAKSLGYSNYFQMKLELEDVNEKELMRVFESLSSRSEAAYSRVIQEIESSQSERFGVAKESLGPWAWGEAFGQRDPLETKGLDELVKGTDVISAVVRYYDRMGVDVREILKRSDMYGRSGKNQSAYCLDVDRQGDVRVLANVEQNHEWLDVVLHELAHAIYKVSMDSELPWLLREVPGVIPNEGIALLFGRQASRKEALSLLVGDSIEKRPLMDLAEKSLKRHQIIFSRWVLVMTEFERGLYQNPEQDLNDFWWRCVEKHQKIRRPEGREGAADWATKVHLVIAPVYYYSYLMGEVFASSVQETLMKKTGATQLATKDAGNFLKENLFKPANRMSWGELVKHLTGSPLSPDAWVSEFGK